MATRYCKGCKKDLPIDEFPPNDSENGPAKTCRPCRVRIDTTNAKSKQKRAQAKIARRVFRELNQNNLLSRAPVATPSPPTVKWCIGCNRNRHVSSFPHGQNALAYSNCNHCKVRRQARDLDDENGPVIAPGRRRTRAAFDEAEQNVQPPARRVRRIQAIQIHEDEPAEPAADLAPDQPIIIDDEDDIPVPDPLPGEVDPFLGRILPRGFNANYAATATPQLFTIGVMDVVCQYCEALHFPGEAINGKPREFEGCCKRGDAVLAQVREPPPELKSLLRSQTQEAKDFRTNLRGYNSALAFVSLSYTKDPRFKPNEWAPCFSLHGQLYHNQGPLREANGAHPQFAQLFFYDAAYSTDVRANNNTTLSRITLSKLGLMLAQHNTFIPIYKSANERLADRQQQPGPFRLLISPQMRLVIEEGADRRRENLPTCDEVAAIIPYETSDATGRDIVLAHRDPARSGSVLSRIHVTHAAYMPLHYVLFFPYGDGSDRGWHYGMLLGQTHHARQNRRLEQRVWYRFRLHQRSVEFGALFYGCKLFHQYLVDAFAACESTLLDWLRKHQANIRADVYSGLQDAVIADDANPAELGKRFVLPSSFIGGERAMNQHYQDSMAIVRHLSKPDFFITVTANPKWPEITRHLKPGQEASDRPDIVARVFHEYIQSILTELKKGLFGPYLAHCYTIEYQKRGLPHMHLLLFVQNKPDFKNPAFIDQVVSAELPSYEIDPTGDLTTLITANMRHGPCGPVFPKAACMIKKDEKSPPVCGKEFPKRFCPQTIVHQDGYPEYRRRDNGSKFTVPHPALRGEMAELDNRWVVPHNPYLLRKYRCHINVEVCGTVQAVKYIHKYVFKGADKTTMAIKNDKDEITRYLQGRYIGPHEALWRLFEYRTHQEFPPVTHLQVHLEGEQSVYFDPDLPAEVLAQKVENARSTLMGFFLYNSTFSDMHHLLYQEFPWHCTWNRSTRKWQKRKNNSHAIGRMYHCSPVAGERFYLRLLLTVIRGPKSFTELKEYDSEVYPTFRAACIARGIADNNQEWIKCFRDAKDATSGRGLRALLLIGLRLNMIPDAGEIWEIFKKDICDDLPHKLQNMPGWPLMMENPEWDYGLYLLGLGLADQQRGLADVNLPVNTFDWAGLHLLASLNYDMARSTELSAIMRAQLNPEQLDAYNTIVQAIAADPTTAHFYLQGPGGTGKTFLYTALCHLYRSQGVTVLCVASTGIAALLLPSGKTSHSAFKIPLNIFDNSTCDVKFQSKLAQELRQVGLIIWDEVPMQNKGCFDIVHKLFTFLKGTSDDVLFGGVPVILGGDFAQILPVVPKGSRADIVGASLQRSFIWPRLKKLRLRTNMRVRNGAEEQTFVRWITGLPYDPALRGDIAIPDCVNQPSTIDGLISNVYPADLLQRAPIDPTAFHRRAILTTLNQTVMDLNDKILKLLPGQERTYHAINSVQKEDDREEGVHEWSAENLQSINLASLPLSELKLKVGSPIMILRNLCPSEGLCNGTRMSVVKLQAWGIHAQFMGGDFDGQIRTIPRILLGSNDNDLTFILLRKQFPIRLAFAMTINKSQGQSMDHVGVDLRTPVFTHGQFYVAMTRVSSCSGLHVILPEGIKTTMNIVWPEVLQALEGI